MPVRTDPGELRRQRLREDQRREIWDGRPPGQVYETWSAVQAAAYLHIHTDTLYALARSGEVPGCKLGRAWVFVPQLLAQYVEKKCQTPHRARAGGVTRSLQSG